MPRIIPRSSGYRRCPVETGCTSDGLYAFLSARRDRASSRSSVSEPTCALRFSASSNRVGTRPESRAFLNRNLKKDLDKIQGLLRLDLVHIPPRRQRTRERQRCRLVNRPRDG